MTEAVPQLATEYVFSLTIAVGPPIEVGETVGGARRVIPILGGSLHGKTMSGHIFETGGADYQIVRADGLTELHARYAIEMADGARIYVENSGIRSGPREALEKIRRGEAVDPSLVYFRSAPRFETESPTYRWLTQSIFVARGARHPDRVEIDVFRVL